MVSSLVLRRLSGKEGGEVADEADACDDEQDVEEFDNNGICVNNEIARHLDEAEALLEEADQQADCESDDDTQERNHQTLFEENPVYETLFGSHRLKDGHIVLLFDTQHRE